MKEENARQAGLPMKRRTTLGYFQKSHANQPGENNIGESIPAVNSAKGEGDSLRVALDFAWASPAVEADLRGQLRRYGIDDRASASNWSMPSATGRPARRSLGRRAVTAVG
jgi:hypothetical protein